MRIFITLAALMLFLLPGHAAADLAGDVIGVKPDSFVIRQDSELPLAVRDQVKIKDTLRTGNTGFLEVLLIDDSSIKLGRDTIISVEEIMPAGVDARFKAHISTGIARVITGKISEQNPEGFLLTTPEATIGVRGTMLAVKTMNGLTTVKVFNAGKPVVVNGIAVQQGFKLTVPIEGARPTPMTAADVQDFTSEWLGIDSSNSQTAANEHSNSNGQSSQGQSSDSSATSSQPGDSGFDGPAEVSGDPAQGAVQLALNNLPSQPQTALAMENVAMDSITDSVGGNNIYTPPVSEVFGTITGFYVTGTQWESGDWGFTLGLTSGTITEGWTQIDTFFNGPPIPGVRQLNVTGGTDQWDKSTGSFSISGFTGTWAGLPVLANTAITGTGPVGNFEIGDQVSATLFINDGTDTYTSNNFSGSRAQ